MSFATAQYRAATVETASPVQIVVRLYDAAIRFLMQAKEAPAPSKSVERGTKLRRAHAIVSELQASLMHNQAPELSQDLDRLYDFVLYAINDAVVKPESELLTSAINVLRELRGAWAELARKGQ